WKLNVLFSGVAVSAAEYNWPSVASIGAAWVYAMLEHKIPVRLRDELADARAMLTGLATGTSLDAVVVSRSRKALTQNRSL
ncbi:MAG: hypothetical protein ABI144_06850, partial [Gallionella sp.]